MVFALFWKHEDGSNKCYGRHSRGKVNLPEKGKDAVPVILFTTEDDSQLSSEAGTKRLG